MTDRIFKYELNFTGQTIEMPIGSEVLCVKIQMDHIMLWAKIPINDDPSRRKRVFRVVATGQETDYTNEVRYIDTVQQEGTGFVFHIFEEITLENMV